jgi:hypothetical protein
MMHSKLAVLVLVAAMTAGVEAQQQPITGDWTFSIEHIGLKLTLEEKNSAVTGALDWPHGDPVKLTGMFANNTLILSGDSAGENFTIHIDVTGTRKTDGTLAGTVKAHFDEFNDAHTIVRVRNQDIPWTAERGLKNVVHFPR